MSFHSLALDTNLILHVSSITVTLLEFHFKILVRSHFGCHPTSNFRVLAETPLNILSHLSNPLQTLESQ